VEKITKVDDQEPYYGMGTTQGTGSCEAEHSFFRGVRFSLGRDRTRTAAAKHSLEWPRPLYPGPEAYIPYAEGPRPRKRLPPALYRLTPSTSPLE